MFLMEIAVCLSSIIALQDKEVALKNNCSTTTQVLIQLPNQSFVMTMKPNSSEVLSAPIGTKIYNTSKTNLLGTVSEQSSIIIICQ